MITNLQENVIDLKVEEIQRHRSKVIDLSQAVLTEPNNSAYHELLNLTLKRLNRLLTA